MRRSECMTLGREKRHGKRHKRHGHDASMTAHDGSAVMAQVSGIQKEAKRHDTMTLDSSKWGDKGKNGSVKHREHELSPKRGGKRDLTKSSVMPSWRPAAAGKAEGEH